MTLGELLHIDRPLVGLDLETTGLSKTARIVEIGLVIEKPGQPVTRYKHYVNPEIPIEPGATERHHITDEMVIGEPTFDKFAPNLVKGFEHADVVGYNVSGDLAKLMQEFKRVKIDWNFEHVRMVDALRLWQVASPRSLQDAVQEFLGHRHVDAHQALPDAVESVNVVIAELHKYQQLPRDVQKLHDLGFGDRFDCEGKLRWREGVLVFGFGKHRDQPVDQAPRDYLLKFICKSDFSEKVKTACREAAAGLTHRRPECVVS